MLVAQEVNVGRNSQNRTLSRRDFLGRVSRGTVASALLPLALRRRAKRPS